MTKAVWSGVAAAVAGVVLLVISVATEVRHPQRCSQFDHRSRIADTRQRRHPPALLIAPDSARQRSELRRAARLRAAAERASSGQARLRSTAERASSAGHFAHTEQLRRGRPNSAHSGRASSRHSGRTAVLKLHASPFRNDPAFLHQQDLRRPRLARRRELADRRPRARRAERAERGRQDHAAQDARRPRGARRRDRRQALRAHCRVSAAGRAEPQRPDAHRRGGPGLQAPPRHARGDPGARRADGRR